MNGRRSLPGLPSEKVEVGGHDPIQHHTSQLPTLWLSYLERYNEAALDTSC